jgi:hypothetical protein
MNGTREALRRRLLLPTGITAPDEGRLSWAVAPLHTVLLAAFPVMFLFAENVADQLVLDPLWQPLAMAVGGATALLLLCVAVTRDLVRGGLIASLLIALFFSFGHVWLLVAETLPSKWHLAAFYGAAAVGGIAIIWRGGQWTGPVSRYANAAAIVLVVLNTFRLADFALGAPARTSPERAGPVAVAGDAELDRRDVYFIVFDRYANAETLERIYGYDNRPFLRTLEARGFVVAEESWASYFKTAPSLLSTLSMEYLDGEVFRQEDDDPPTMAPVHRRLQERLPVPATFKELGYEYVHIGNWWSATSRNVDADLSLTYERYSEFGAALLNTTAWALLEPVEQAQGEPRTLEGPELARRHTLFAFERLEEAVRRPGATFVFAHLLIPHPPYAFARDGSMPTAEERESSSRERLYVEQLQYANRRILDVVDQALDVPRSEEPMIILQADEGPYPGRFAREPETFDWLEATPEEIQEKYGILNAMYLPGVDAVDAGIHDGMSPVNTFRIVFNEYFGAELPLLPDRVYLTPSYARMYDFTEYERP